MSTSLGRGAGEVEPLPQRILGSALLMAVFGSVLGLIGLDEPLPAAIASGALLGLLGLRPLKLALGLLVGAITGLLFGALDADVEPALVAAAVAIACHGRNAYLIDLPASESASPTRGSDRTWRAWSRRSAPVSRGCGPGTRCLGPAGLPRGRVLRRVCRGASRPAGAHAREPQLRAGGRRSRVGPDRVAGAPRPSVSSRRPERPHHRCLGRRRNLRRPDGEGVRSGRDGCRSTPKVELVSSLGADRVIDYTREDITDDSRRYDVVLDIGGNRPLRQLRRARQRWHAGLRRRRGR